MAYTRPWNSATPAGTLAANQIDNALREKLVDLEERLNTLIGNSNWSSGVDPVIDGITIKSLLALTTALTSPSTLNVTTLLNVNRQFTQGVIVNGGNGATLTYNWADSNFQSNSRSVSSQTIVFTNALPGTMKIFLTWLNTGLSTTWPANLIWAASAPVSTLNVLCLIDITYDGATFYASYVNYPV